MSLSNILVIIAIIVFIISAIIFLWEMYDYSEMNFSILGFILALLIVIASSITRYIEDEAYKETAKTSMEKGYEVYIDGIKTDHIDFTQYENIKIDTKNQIIYVSVSQSD